ncbi:hypothetical protein T281_08905 [Rhodomicrobium udaipurense JA643]|uniref:Alkane 1-monooxygenase n=1 Tax=Rhodomicrobium udaipurense TaxID=1202716 RepID=A0A8I1GI01_9HYPH|nr:hypothetical protein [Rhodomicrobium udaipurense]KAI94823.1 hypothetical protein T281_08905 [Rhodomicrobium udaipurense JA643]MBJ7544641.1 hypothetical protein [Rhodomicrobium udaipurense]
MRALPVLVSLAFVPLAALALLHGGPWLLALLVYGPVVVPVADHVFGLCAQVAPASRVQCGFAFAWVPIQFALVLGLAASADTLGGSALFVAAIGIGLATGGVGGASAFALLDRGGRYNRAAAELLTWPILYGSFAVRHGGESGARAATPKDPATPRLGEGFYSYFLRSTFIGLFAAWDAEEERLHAAGLSTLSLSNAFLRAFIAYAVLIEAAFLIGGALGVMALFVQAFVAWVVIDAGAYVARFGLLRRPLGQGHFEPLGPQHAWSATGDVPRLPGGFCAMALLATLWPERFVRLMNPRVLAWHARWWETATPPAAPETQAEATLSEARA